MRRCTRSSKSDESHQNSQWILAAKIDTGPRAVERRVGHELVIHRERSVFLKLKIVIGFQGLFRAVAQRAVAVEYAQAAGLQEFLVRVRSAAYRCR